MLPTLIAGLFLLLTALVVLVAARRLRTQTGLPGGAVISSDVSLTTRGKRMRSEKYGLSGTPDYIVDTPRGPVPVEVKPTRTDSEPHESHILQVLAYCVLLEETTGKRPPYGLLKYSAETFRIDYNRETRGNLLAVVEAMRADAANKEVHRSHDVPGKCWACVYRTVCEESLA
jgi:CRISPR-associated exonuclease Cas4